MKTEPSPILKRFWDGSGNKVTYTLGKQKTKLWLIRHSMLGARAAACFLWCELRIDMGTEKASVAINGKTLQPSAEEILECGRDPKVVGLSTKKQKVEQRKEERKKTQVKIESTSVAKLLKQLRTSTDAGTKRKLRGLLRKAGHQGGLGGKKVKKQKRGRRAKKGRN